MESFILGFVFGVIGNIVASYLFELFRRPKLIISIGNKTESTFLPKMHSVNYSFLHLDVTNQDRFGLTNPALAVKARITFKNKESMEELFSIDGRWSGNPEPIIPMTLDGSEGRVNPTLFPLLRKIDILAGETQELDVAIKYSGDESIYAFSNENYGPPEERMWLKKDWEIKLKNILLEVLIYSGNLKVKKSFVLLNNSNKIEDTEITKVGASRKN